MTAACRLGLAAVLVLAIAASPGPAPATDGPLSRRGTHEGGRYVIDVPASWNGELVLFPGNVALVDGGVSRRARIRAGRLELP